MVERKKHYWYLNIEDIYERMQDVKVKQLRDSIILALERNVHYASIMTEDGVNRIATSGHKPDNIKDDEWIKILDENREVDILATANRVVKDMLVTGAIIVMRYEDEMYDVITEDDKTWLNNILAGDF